MKKKILLFDAPKGFLIYPKHIYNKINNLKPDHGFYVLNKRQHNDQNVPNRLRYAQRSSIEVAYYCRKIGYKVTHFDYDAKLIKTFKNISPYIENISNYYDKFFSLFPTEDNYDYILCSIQKEMTYIDYILELQIQFTKKLLHYIRSYYPDSKIIVGGSNVLYTGSDWSVSNKVYNALMIAKNSPINTVVHGSVDKEIMKDILTSDKRFYKIPLKDSSFPPIQKKIDIVNDKDLKYSYDFIFKYYDLQIPKPEYKNRYIKQIESKIVLGCKGICAFCNSTKGITLLSFDKLKDLIMSYIDNGYNSFFFLNDAINPVAEQFCNWVIKNNIKIFWSDDSRHSQSPDYYKMLYEAGGFIINFGAETFDNTTLKYIRKGATKESMLSSLQYSHDANIWNIVNVIFNLPYSKSNDIQITEQVVLDNEHLINRLLLNHFLLTEESPFYNNPTAFKINYLKSGRIKRRQIWKETHRRNYTQIKQDNEKNLFPQRLKGHKSLIEVPQHLIFALYDIFKTKDKVSQWLDNNYYKKRICFE